jgi:hypothetical protein
MSAEVWNRTVFTRRDIERMVLGALLQRGVSWASSLAGLDLISEVVAWQIQTRFLDGRPEDYAWSFTSEVFADSVMAFVREVEEVEVEP